VECAIGATIHTSALPFLGSPPSRLPLFGLVLLTEDVAEVLLDGPVLDTKVLSCSP
jgi:hypothetical protein